ncbi:MAG: hypothetical protein ACKOX6_16260 [Bdellovibrio sp.]
MTTLKLLFTISLLFVSSLSLATPQPGFKSIGTKEVKEDDVTFRWTSSDGEIQLKCAHVYDKPDAWDWDVYCGKGTNMLRIYRVHFLVRQYAKETTNKKALEILYWVTDRNQPTPKFSSTSQWIQLHGQADLDFFNLSVGVENDYGTLDLTYRPR